MKYVFGFSHCPTIKTMSISEENHSPSNDTYCLLLKTLEVVCGITQCTLTAAMGGASLPSLSIVKLPSLTLAKHNILLESCLFAGILEIFAWRGFSWGHYSHECHWIGQPRNEKKRGIFFYDVVFYKKCWGDILWQRESTQIQVCE